MSRKPAKIEALYRYILVTENAKLETPRLIDYTVIRQSSPIHANADGFTKFDESFRVNWQELSTLKLERDLEAWTKVTYPIYVVVTPSIIL